MGEETKKQPEVSPKPSDNLEVETLDPAKKAEKLAEKQLEMKQKAEKKAVEAEHQEKQTDVQAKSAVARADVLASAPEKPADSNDQPKTSGEKPVATSDQPVPGPDVQPAPPAAAPAVNADTPAPANASEESKDMWAKVKEFFSGLSEKISAFFSKLFGGKTDQPADPANPAAAPAASPEVPSGPDSTAGLYGKALLENAQFKARTDQIAAKIGVSTSDLYAIFGMEGVTQGKGVDPQAVNPTSGASGLIQWIPKYSPVPVEEIRKMTGLQQLELVDKHFSRWAGKLKSFSDLYRTVFFPASIGKGPDYIFGSEDGKAELYAKENSGIAKFCGRPDGLIDNAGFERYANSRRPKDSALLA